MCYFNGGGTNVLNGFGNDAQQTIIILGSVGAAALDFGVNNTAYPSFSFTNRIVALAGNMSLQDSAGNSISLSAGSFIGSGFGLTDIPDSALSANVPKLQNNNVFSGINIVPALLSDNGQIYSDGSGNLYVGQNIQGGYFHGDGQNLTNIPVASQNLTGIFTNVLFVQTNSYGISYATNGGTLTVWFGLNPSVPNLPTTPGLNGYVLSYTNIPPYCYWAPPRHRITCHLRRKRYARQGMESSLSASSLAWPGRLLKRFPHFTTIFIQSIASRADLTTRASMNGLFIFILFNPADGCFWRRCRRISAGWPAVSICGAGHPSRLVNSIFLISSGAPVSLNIGFRSPPMG